MPRDTDRHIPGATFARRRPLPCALQGAYRSIAELGLIFALFFIGLETRAPEIFKVGRRAPAVATLGVLVPFTLGYGSMRRSRRADIEAPFVGAALSATSTGITAAALRDISVIRSTEARIMLGATVTDDVLELPDPGQPDTEEPISRA